MSGDSPPPKPKPGSLRDRIAAFEQKPAQQSAPPLAPRPKPGHVQWKPRSSSPPPAPVNAGEAGEHAHHGAADAKESIGAGGMSLKERMAALQGRGAFAPPPVSAPVPKPTGERKWKPPLPPVALPADPESGAGEADPGVTAKSPVSGGEGEGTDGALEHTDATHEGEAAPGAAAEGGEDNPEEEERKRRAAIAARLARLGGARIGMGPPVFAPKPRASAPPKEETRTSLESADEAPAEKTELPSGSSETSLLSPNSATSGTPDRSSPTSMPVPSGPRRAAPPRRRPPKSPSTELPPLASEAEGKEEIGTPVNNAERDEKKLEDESSIPAVKEKEKEEEEVQEEEKEEKEETEEEAAARRKRIADRIAKSGGVNPFAGPRSAPVQSPTDEVEGRVLAAEEEEGMEKKEEIAKEASVGAELDSDSASVPAVVRVSSDYPTETHEAGIEGTEAEIEAPPLSSSEADEPQSPPLPPKLTSAEVGKVKSKPSSPTTPTALASKENEPHPPVVDLSKPSEVSETLDKDEKEGADADPEKDHSVDITEAAAEYKDVLAHAHTRDDLDDDADEKERKGGHVRKDSGVLSTGK